MIFNIIIFIFTVFVAISIYNFQKNRRFWKLFYEFNGDKPLPIIGNALSIGADSMGIWKSLVQMWERNGMTDFRIEIGPNPVLIISDVNTVESILESSKEINKSQEYKFIKPWLGDGLLLSSGKKWHARRKIITPAFHFKILEQFVPIFEKKGSIFIEQLQKFKGRVCDIYPLVTLYTLDVITESAMGVDIDVQINSDTDYVKAIFSIAQIAHHRSFSIWKRSQWLYVFSQSYRDERKLLNTIHTTTKNVIKTRKRQLEQESKEEKSNSKGDEEEDFYRKKKYAFLDLLLLSRTSDGLPLSDEDIRDEVDTIMFAGQDTTASCISFTLYLLAQNPEVQKEAFLEQFSIFGKDCDKQASYDDLQNMNYLERVIKESLRVYPAVPMVGRKMQNDMLLKDGKVIPTGAQLFINFFLMFKDPKYWKDPMRFDPDRFLPENIVNRNRFVHVPFSAGPRNCIGQKFAMLEIKSLLSKVLRNFQLSCAGEQYEPQLTAEMVLKSNNGINIVFDNRKY